MRERMGAVLVLIAGLPGVAVAAPGPVAAAPRRAVPAGDFRLKPLAAPANPMLRVDDPRSMLRTGYGGALVDLFPLEGGKFHLSGGGRLFGRPGRAHVMDAEPLRPLQPFRAGSLRGKQRFSPAMLVGYGRTVDRGLALGIDAGVVMGKLGATPDRLGHLNRRRLESIDGHGQRKPWNEIARVTALYRF